MQVRMCCGDAYQEKRAPSTCATREKWRQTDGDAEKCRTVARNDGERHRLWRGRDTTWLASSDRVRTGLRNRLTKQEP